MGEGALVSCVQGKGGAIVFLYVQVVCGGRRGTSTKSVEKHTGKLNHEEQRVRLER